MSAVSLDKIKEAFQQNELKVPCYKAKKTFSRILELMGKCPTINGKQSWANITKKIEAVIMQSSFYITNKGDLLVDELYNNVKDQGIDSLIVDEALVYQAQHLVFVYYKRVIQFKKSEVNYVLSLERFIKTLILYVYLNSSLQMYKLSKELINAKDDFVFVPTSSEQLSSPVSEINKLYLYLEYLKEISQISIKDFSNEMEICFEKITMVVEKSNMPINFKTYQWIKERYHELFLREISVEPALDNYLWVLLYDEVAKRRYILDTKLKMSKTSKERKAFFKELFYRAEHLTLECTSGKSARLFGPMLYINGGYDKKKNEFNFEFTVSVNSRQPGEMYYINNLSNVVLQFTYSAVNEITAKKLMNKICNYNENILMKGRIKSELFGIYGWLFFYSMSSVAKDVDGVLAYKECCVEDYYFVSVHEREKVWAFFNMIEEILYYKKSIVCRILFEVNNTTFKPQEKGSYYDANYDEIWGDNHIRWREVVKTDYRWKLDHF